MLIACSATPPVSVAVRAACAPKSSSPQLPSAASVRAAPLDSDRYPGEHSSPPARREHGAEELTAAADRHTSPRAWRGRGAEELTRPPTATAPRVRGGVAARAVGASRERGPLGTPARPAAPGARL